MVWANAISRHREAPTTESLGRMRIRGSVEAFHHDVGINFSSEADKFSSVHLLAIIFSELTIETSPLGRTFGHIYDDLVRIDFNIVSDEDGPWKVPHCLDETVQPTLPYLEPLDDIPCRQSSGSRPHPLVEMVRGPRSLFLFDKYIPKSVYNPVMPHEEFYISFQLFTVHSVKVHEMPLIF